MGQGLTLEDAGPGDRVTLDGDVEFRPVLGLGNDLEAPGVDDHGVLGPGGVDARAPSERHAGLDREWAVRQQGDLAGGIAGDRPLVVEGPLVGPAELLVDPPGPAEDLGGGLAGPGEV